MVIVTLLGCSPQRKLEQPKMSAFANATPLVNARPPGEAVTLMVAL